MKTKILVSIAGLALISLSFTVVTVKHSQESGAKAVVHEPITSAPVGGLVVDDVTE